MGVWWVGRESLYLPPLTTAVASPPGPRALTNGRARPWHRPGPSPGHKDDTDYDGDPDAAADAADAAATGDDDDAHYYH